MLSSLKKSSPLDFVSEFPARFAHFDFHNFPENLLPDNEQIIERLLSKSSPLPDFSDCKLLLILIERKRIETWSEQSTPVFFQELIEIRPAADFPGQNSKLKTQNLKLKIRGCVWKNPIAPEILLKLLEQNPQTPFEAVAQNRKSAIIQADQPLRLEALNIPKPWGHESWYTGVEKRGVVKVADKWGKTELPYALGIFKKQMLADYPENLILLKTLNPHTQDVAGDLYLEMHEEKWEVYVVTEIDRTAWPSGSGIIKAGLHPQKITAYQQKYGGDWAKPLLNDFRKAVKEYENIRNQIDKNPEKIEAQLSATEKKLRKKADDFVGDCPVKVGDIVTFPVFQMHSLRHGIKVIEFQTPHYERLIVMFAQKVLTQNHWDTEAALEKMRPEIYQPPQLQLLHEAEGVRIERFVDFPQFTADRICLESGRIWEERLAGQYHLLIVVSGQASVFPESGEAAILNPPEAPAAEESLFLPAGMESYQLKSSGTTPLICLKARPKFQAN